MNKLATLLVAVGALVLLILATCLTKVRLNEVGVKVHMVGGSGIDDEDYGPGYYFLVPGVHKMYRLDPTVQTYQMGGAGGNQPLKLRARDQYTTQFDITILYRIMPGKAHVLAQQVGMETDRIERFVRSRADRALWDVLGRLDTQLFYNVDRRETAREDAKQKLATTLEPNSIELVDILIREIKYDPKFEERLVQKQLLDQNKALNVEKTRLEKELQITESIQRETAAMVKVIDEERIQEVATIVAETDAKIQEIEADADLTAQKLIAEADRHRRTKISEGELAMTQAKAKGEKAINEAYQGIGGQAYITRQMIDAIEFGEIEVNTNKVNPFDVNQILRMLGLDPKALNEKTAGE